MPQAVITGVASYVPKKIMTNHDLEQMVQTSDEWITTRTGVRERHIAADDEFSSTMGIRASQILLDRYGVSADDIDLILVSTMSPDFLSPSTATIIQHGLKARKAAAFDIQAACSGFIYGLTVAKALVVSGTYKTVLLVATEKNSAIVDFTDRNTCVLFGDGAGAALITNGGPGLTIQEIVLGADGEHSGLIHIPAGGSQLPPSPKTVENRQHFLRMQGREVFKQAVLRMEESIHLCLEQSQLSIDDIQWIIPHQANIRIIEALMKRYGLSSDRVVITIDRFANTSSSTIPIAIESLTSRHSIAPGDRILLTAVGGGLTWGTALLQHIL